jgi:uracil phosphoribosyltransferase
MRAGLYIAEGVRQLLGDNHHIYLLSNNPNDVIDSFISGRNVVIIDSVINSGQTLMAYLNVFKSANSLTVIALVMQEKCKLVIEHLYPDVNFIISRVSQNSYVGAGQTDTGNRLFGTY